MTLVDAACGRSGTFGTELELLVDDVEKFKNSVKKLVVKRGDRPATNGPEGLLTETVTV